MPSKTKKQATFMRMSAKPKGRARLRSRGVNPAPIKIAKEFVRADKKKGKK